MDEQDKKYRGELGAWKRIGMLSDFVVQPNIKFLDRTTCCYENNRTALNSYRFWWHTDLPSADNLPLVCFRLGKYQFTYFDKEKKILHNTIRIQRSDNVEYPFFSDLEKPILVENEYNVHHLEYLYDNVRKSEDYGEDNHIYLSYNDFYEFVLLLCVEDITTLLTDEKFIFLFGEEKETLYPLDLKNLYGLNYSNMKQRPIRIEEIHRIVINLHRLAGMGNTFLSGILDFHKDLLTIKKFGMAEFTVLYEMYLSSKCVIDFEIEFKTKQMDENIYRAVNEIFFSSGNVPTPNVNTFFSFLKKLFPETYHPSRIEWIKGIFLAYSSALGRKFTSRISPAIKFETHVSVLIPGQNVWTYNDSFFMEFKYVYQILPLRRGTTALGSWMSAWMRGNVNKVFFLSKFIHAYLIEISVIFKKKGQKCPFYAIRFEDLKLQPKATLLSLIEYLDIQWDDVMMKSTENGMSSDSSAFGTTDFDTKPVYKHHYDAINFFDQYRLELVMSKYWKYFGYEPLFYKENIIYTKEEILKMFELPFQCEKYHTTEEQKRQNITARKQMYALVEKRLSEGDVPLDENGEEMVPIPWLKPKPELVDGELYK